MAITPKTRPYKHVAAIEVQLWGMHIGSVALDPAYGYYAFAYTPEFAATGLQPAPLHMPVRAGEVYLFTELPEATFKRLPAMLSDALPDDFGNALINRYMAEQGIAAQDVSALDRLAYMSSRAMGALSFKPARGPSRQIPTAIELGALVEQARQALTGYASDDEHTNAALRSIIEPKNGS